MDIIYSKELLNIFQYINHNLIVDFKIKTITPEHFIIAVIMNKDCIANSILDKILSSEIKSMILEKFTNNLKTGDYENFSILSKIINSYYSNNEIIEMNTMHVLLGILSYDCSCKKELNSFGITFNMIKQYSNSHEKIKDNNEDKQAKQSSIQSKSNKKNINNKSIETYSINLNDLSLSGKIDKFVGGDNIYKQIFNVLGKMEKNNIIVVGNNGVGKCLGRGTKVMMYSGDSKKIEDVKVGDFLMGPDSKKRIVMSLGHGYDKMYKVVQDNGMTYTVNSKHILSLKTKDGLVCNIEISDYLKLDEEKKSKLFGWKPNGVLSNGNKEEYLEMKKRLLSIILKENNMTKNGEGYFISCDSCKCSYVMKLCNMIGIRCKKDENGVVAYTSLSFLKNNEFPKNTIFSKIKIEEIGVDEYFGFEIDGDKLFLLSDCTVTHNTSLIKNIANILNYDNTIPSKFENKKILLLDPSVMLFGATYRGLFEDRFKSFIDEIKRNKNYILFIDDIHNHLSDKIQDGNLNIANLLIPVLNENSIPFICATNFKEYKSLIESNPNLSSKFQKIILNPPSLKDVVNILNETKEKYEIFHNVTYTNEAIEACAKLSDRYINDRSMPDSSISLMDEVGSMVSAKVKKDTNIDSLKKELLDILNRKKEILSKEDMNGIDEIKKKESEIKNKISLEERNKRNYYKKIEVEENDVKIVLSEKIGIPLFKLSINDKNELNDLNNRVKKSVIGQDIAIDKICNAIKRKRVGIADNNKPCAMLLIGKTGVGKTLVAKTLAKEIFGDENSLVRLDMSEYSEKSSVTKITGSAPGYIGYENGGQLTEAIKNKKYCILLLDEIEKAHQEVHNVFLQLLDEGRLTDNSGQVVDFKNVIILMTSNVGAKRVSEFGDGIGFTKNKEQKSNSIFEKELKKTFTPEFLNRLDDIIYFSDLSESDIKDIIKLELIKLNKRVEDIGYRLHSSYLSEEVVNSIYNKIDVKNEFGAREVLRIIQNEIENKITDYILSKNNADKEIPFLE